MKRKRVKSPYIRPLGIMIYMRNLKGMGLKTSRRGACFSEKVNTSPKRTFLEGEETGRKCSGCVQKHESDFAGKYIMARQCSAKKSSLLQTK